MAKVVITITDMGNDVCVDCEFDPPLKKGENTTKAQSIADDMLEVFDNYQRDQMDG